MIVAVSWYPDSIYRGAASKLMNTIDFLDQATSLALQHSMFHV
jgi:hypothetical protein